MQEFDDYKLVKLISENSTTQIFLGEDGEKNHYILKILRKERVNSDTIARYKKEYEVGSSISSELVLKSLNYLGYRGQAAIVFENFESISLKKLIQEYKGVKSVDDIIRFLKISKQIVEAIEVIHDNNYIHRDINPTNILINPATDQVKIIDFGLATELITERSVLKGYKSIEGTLPYMSPEQTGRVNRVLDFHTDFYSLGICMYEMLCGKLPFIASGLREWVHAHVARQALPLSQVNPLLPEQLSLIVRKLMNKDAGLRYKSSYGLISDIEKCIVQLEETGKVEQFKLGENDISTKFQLPQRLYGRENEVAELLNYYHDVRKGHTGFVFIKGSPGVGKSALVGELYKQVTEHNGYFTKGKFKQLNQSKPYSAIIQAFSQLVNNILAEDKEKLNAWKSRLLKHLNGNAGIISQVIPELNQIIGSQKPAEELPAVETKNRFILTFHNFVSCFVSDGTPLLIFLDDLQWADGASLELIQNILSDTNLGPILFIGGYRSEELQRNKQVLGAVQNIMNSQIFTKEIHLKGLGENEIKNLLIDIYSCEEFQAEIIANQCFKKTEGVPFFLLEFLTALNKANAIYFNKELNKWSCDIEAVKKANVTNNVVDLVCQNIADLPESIQDILKVAACIGSVFNSVFLSLMVNRNENSLIIDLDKAVKASMLVPVRKIYVFANMQEHLGVEYEFLHERVRQAAYSMLLADEKIALHLKIGRQLVQDNNVTARSELLFNVVDHLNIGINNLNADEVLKVANYNLEAGKRSKSSGAFEPAYNYLQKALGLAKRFLWDEEYDIKLSIYTHTAEAAYFCGEYEKMEEIASELFANTKQELDVAELWNIRSLAYQAQHKMELIEKDAFSYLGNLGVVISPIANNFKVLYSVLKTEFALRKFSTEALKKLKPATDKNIVEAMNMLGVMVYPYYGENPKLFVIMLTKLLRLTLKYGTVSISPFAFMMYGMILNAMFGKILKGYTLGQVGLSLLHKIGDKKHWAEISVCYNLGVRIWKEPLKNATEGLIEDFKIALDTGDIEFAVMSLSSCSNYLFFKGEHLNDILKTAEQYNRSLAHIPQSEGRVIMDMQLQAIDNLQNKAIKSHELEGRFFSESAFLSEGKRFNDSILTNLYMLKMMNAYFLNDYATAFENSKKGRKHLQGVVGIYHYATFVFYEALVLIENIKSDNSIGKSWAMRRVVKNKAKIKDWAKHSPANFLNKYKLICAGIAKLKGNIELAGELYDESIDLAEQNGFIHEEALANEKAGELWLHMDRIRFARVYLTKAVKLYQLWNAKTKYDQLEKKYKDLIYIEHQTDDYLESRAVSSVSSTVSTDSIDLRTVLEASKTISGEIVLSELFAKTLRIIMEHAGAQRGILLLINQISADFDIEAIGNVRNNQVEVILSKQEITDQLMPLSLIRYVERNKKPIVLKSAYQYGNFTNDTYIKSYQIESVSVLPIMHQSRMLGVLYLENNLSPNVFTDKQAGILSLMCTQLAVSIENARVYNTLEQKVQERTEEVLSQKLELENQAVHLTEINTQLEELNATKDKLFSIIGHDLSNPFNAIIGFSGLLLKHLDKLDEKEIRRRIGIINKSSKKSYELLQNLLEWSRSQVDRLEYNPTKIWLCDLVNQNLSMLGASAEAKYIVLSNKVGEDIFVKADEYMLNTIIRNLLSNAIKFTEKGGEVHVNAALDNNKVKIVVVDNGIGMESDSVDNLFNINATITTSGTENEKGTGLGLLLCKDLVERHESKILVESEKGVGTAVSFELPIC